MELSADNKLKLKNSLLLLTPLWPKKGKKQLERMSWRCCKLVWWIFVKQKTDDMEPSTPLWYSWTLFVIYIININTCIDILSPDCKCKPQGESKRMISTLWCPFWTDRYKPCLQDIYGLLGRREKESKVQWIAVKCC